MCDFFFQNSKLFGPGQNIPFCQKSAVGDFQLLQSILHILARKRLLGRFTTFLAQTTTASRLLFALGWHFMPRENDFFFEILELNFL